MFLTRIRSYLFIYIPLLSILCSNLTDAVCESACQWTSKVFFYKLPYAWSTFTDHVCIQILTPWRELPKFSFLKIVMNDNHNFSQENLFFWRTFWATRPQTRALFSNLTQTSKSLSATGTLLKQVKLNLPRDTFYVVFVLCLLL